MGNWTVFGEFLLLLYQIWGGCVRHPLHAYDAACVGYCYHGCNFQETILQFPRNLTQSVVLYYIGFKMYVWCHTLYYIGFTMHIWCNAFRNVWNAGGITWGGTGNGLINYAVMLLGSGSAWLSMFYTGYRENSSTHTKTDIYCEFYKWNHFMPLPWIHVELSWQVLIVIGEHVIVNPFTS
jgi:hypothetical protein